MRGMSNSMTLATPDLATVRRLGDRACVIELGEDFSGARAADDLAAGAAVGGAREFVFDLTNVHRYDSEALVELAALCRRLVSYGCDVFVAAHDPGVTLELRRLAHGDGWKLAATLPAALTELLSRPI
jgi:anti-anti-sigma regulatory factor